MSKPSASRRPDAGPILIVSAGNTFPSIQATLGDFDDWIAAGLGHARPIQRLDARAQTLLPPPQRFAGIVVSGSHAMVTDQAPWSEGLAAWMRDCLAQGVPLLGICFGHQLLAHAQGGLVGNRAQGFEVGTHQVERVMPQADPLFDGLPPSFGAPLVHAQSVLALPPGAVLLARSAGEPHQAFRSGPCAWGVQFHPELGTAAMHGYVRELAASGAIDAATVQVCETPWAAMLLRRFASICAGTTSA